MPGTCHLVRKKLQCTDLLTTSDFSVSSCFLTQVKASCDETRTKWQKLLASQLNFTWKIPGNICHERNCLSIPVDELIANRWQSMNLIANRCQSMTFLWLLIGHRLADTNRYQLTNFIDWYWFIECISDHRFHRLVMPGIKHSFQKHKRKE